MTSQDEVFSFPLFSYFSGNNLEFNITSTSAKNLDVQIQDPFSMELLTHIPYLTDNAYPGTKPTSVLMDVAYDAGTTYVFNPVNNGIQAYSVGYQGDVQPAWTYEVETTFKQPVIQRIRHYTDALGNGYIVVLMQSIETEDNQESTRFDVYLLSLPDITAAPTSALDLDIEDFRYYAKVDLVPIITPSSQTILIVSCGAIDSGVETDFLMGYNMTDVKQVAFLQQIDTYKNIPGAGNGVPLHTVGIAYINDILYVLDREVGLVTFVFMEEDFLESDFIDIVRFGTPTCVNSPVGGGNYLALGTSKGLLVIDFTENDNEFKWIPIVLADGNPWVPSSAVLSGHYIFINAQQFNQYSFIVADYESDYFSSVKRLWDLEPEVGTESFLPFAMYTVVQLLNPNQYIYFRSDKDALRVFSLAVGRWELQGTASDSTPYEADICAIDLGDPLAVANSTLKVNYIAQKNTTILCGSGYLLSDQIDGPVLTPNIMGTNALASIPISEYFSGPSVEYKLDFSDIPAGLTLDYLPQMTKMSISEPLPLLEVSPQVLLLGVASEYIYLSEGSTLHQYYTNGTLSNSTTLSGEAEALSFADGGDGSVFVLTKTADGEEIMSLDSYSLEVMERVNVPAGCVAIKLLINYIYCISQSELAVFDVDLAPIYQITTGSLGLKTLQISDIAAQFSQYSQHFILFISCKDNGLVAVDITNLPFNPASLSVSIQMAGATAGVYLFAASLQILVQVNGDGSIYVFDIENSPTAPLMKQMPSWAAEEAPVFWGKSEGIAAIGYANQLYFYDYANTVHNSLFAVQPVQGTFQLKGSAGAFYALTTDPEVTLTIYTPIGTSTPQGLQFTYDVSVTLDPNEFLQDSEAVLGTLTASNSFGSQVSIPVLLNVESQGHVIFINSTALPTTDLIIPYNTSSSLPLFTVFSGQNLDLYININGVYPWIYYNETNYNPAILWPVVEYTDHYTFSADLYDNTTSSSILLLPNNLTLSLAGTLLSVYTITGVAHGEWTQVPNATFIGSIDLTDLTHNEDLQDCPLITLVTSSSDSVLLAVYCYGVGAVGLGASGEASYSQLSFVNFNLTTHNATEAYSELLLFSPALFRARNATEPRQFYFAMIDALTGSENNHMLWSKMMWMLDGSVTYVTNQTVVDFFLLGLDLLCIADVDVLPSGNGAVIYVADACYGLRVVVFNPGSEEPIKLFNSTGLPVMPNSWVTGDVLQSLRICNGLLFAMETSTIILRFSLSTPLSPTPLPPFQRYNTAQLQYHSSVPSLTCSSMNSQSGGFIAARLSDGNGNAVARIFDLEADLDSAILKDISLGAAPDHYTQIFSFYGGGLISTLEDGASAFGVWLLRHAYLEFPQFTDNGYQKMVEQWGTPNFTIKVTAINQQMALNTTSVFVSRQSSSPSPPSKPSNGSSPSYWWVWLLIAILVILTFIGVFIGIRVYRKRRGLSSSSRSISLAEEPLTVDEFRE
jgi:hypothetical protein